MRQVKKWIRENHIFFALLSGEKTKSQIFASLYPENVTWDEKSNYYCPNKKCSRQFTKKPEGWKRLLRCRSCDEPLFENTSRKMKVCKECWTVVKKREFCKKHPLAEHGTGAPIPKYTTVSRKISKLKEKDIFTISWLNSTNSIFKDFEKRGLIKAFPERRTFKLNLNKFCSSLLKHLFSFGQHAESPLYHKIVISEGLFYDDLTGMHYPVEESIGNDERLKKWSREMAHLLDKNKEIFSPENWNPVFSPEKGHFLFPFTTIYGFVNFCLLLILIDSKYKKRNVEANSFKSQVLINVITSRLKAMGAKDSHVSKTREWSENGKMIISDDLIRLMGMIYANYYRDSYKLEDEPTGFYKTIEQGIRINIPSRHLKNGRLNFRHFYLYQRSDPIRRLIYPIT